MPHYCWLPSVPPVSVSSFRSLSYTFRCTNIVFFLSIFRENLHPFCELKILYYLCIPFRTQNAAASNQVVFSDGLHVMSLPEGVCERVVIGSQARLRIWCLRAYGFESLRSHFIKRSRSVPPVSFFAPARRVLDNRSGPRGLVPLCHCVTSPEGERKRLPSFRSLAHIHEVEEYIPGLFCTILWSHQWKVVRKNMAFYGQIVSFAHFVRIKTFLTYKLLIVIVMSVNNRFNPDKITHINFSREHP